MKIIFTIATITANVFVRVVVQFRMMIKVVQLIALIALTTNAHAQQVKYLSKYFGTILPNNMPVQYQAHTFYDSIVEISSIQAGLGTQNPFVILKEHSLNRNVFASPEILVGQPLDESATVAFTVFHDLLDVDPVLFETVSDIDASPNTKSSVQGVTGEMGAQVYWGMQTFFNFTNARFSHKGYDKAGLATVNIVLSPAASSSFYMSNKYFKTYTDIFLSVPPMKNPQISLDVVGHEITHGILDISKNIQGTVYDPTLPELREAFCDILAMGAMRKYSDPNTWVLGDKCLNDKRDFADPSYNLYGSKWTYPVQYLIYDYHRNSLVVSNWYYRLIYGASGTSEVKKKPFNFSPINPDPKVAEEIALQLVWNTRWTFALVIGAGSRTLPLFH